MVVAAVAGAALVLGVGFALRAGALDAAANVVQVLSGVPLLVALWTWATHREEDQPARWAELGELLQVIADADGLTTKRLCRELRRWQEDEIAAFLQGTRHPEWTFITAFIALVAKEDGWRQEVLLRRVRVVWEAGGTGSRTVPDSREWAKALREAVHARKVLGQVYESADRYDQLEAGLAEMMARLRKAVDDLLAERQSLRKQLATRHHAPQVAMKTEIDRLTRQLADAEQRLRAAQWLQRATNDRLDEANRQHRQAEELKNRALHRAGQAATRLATLDSTTPAPPKPAALARHTEPTPALMGPTDQDAARAILERVDQRLSAEASKLHGLQDVLVANGEPDTSKPFLHEGGKIDGPDPAVQPSSGFVTRRRMLIVGSVAVAGAGVTIPVALSRKPEVGTQFAEPLKGHFGAVEAVAVGVVNGKVIAVSGGADTTVRRWDLMAGRAADTTIGGGAGVVTGLAFGVLQDKPVIISGGTDATVRVWDAGTGAPIGSPLVGHSGPVNAVAASRTVMASAGSDGTVRLWDLAKGQAVGDPLSGHAGPVNTVAIGTWKGRSIVISGGDDQTVRMWDAGAGAPIGNPLKGHAKEVNTVAFGTVSRQTVAISGGSDGTARVWDLTEGRAIGAPMDGHAGIVNAVAVGALHGRLVVVCGGDEMVQVWDPVKGHRLDGETPSVGKVFAAAIGTLGGKSIVVFGGSDELVHVWFLGTP
ncbi:hypothetical protein GCM10009733_082800 [Nonomuraea maheshkhaliensis]|uniref:WD40 repeat domain-containing protein n=1 Tax=Nonomuraea maheshkhaliensis TaxID=419590 RepID=A0ABN2GL61_9ACTN